MGSVYEKKPLLSRVGQWITTERSRGFNGGLSIKTLVGSIKDENLGRGRPLGYALHLKNF
jgi:hypothetical protein